MTVTFVDPRGTADATIQPYQLSADLTATPSTVALLANGFPGSEEFLDAIEAAMSTQVPTASFARYNKRNASSLVSDEMLADIRERCDVVVAAYGH